MHFVGVIQWSKIRKLMHFSKGKLTEEDENSIASTWIPVKNPSNDQTVQPDEQLCKILIF